MDEEEKEDAQGTQDGQQPEKPPTGGDDESNLAGNADLLVPEETYLTSGVHIGTQQKSADMKRFLFKIRNDGLYVLDIKETDRRIRDAAAFLARYRPDEILVVSARQYGQKPCKMFAKATGAKELAGRFVPGSLTNPKLPTFQEPKVLVVTDPSADIQALREAILNGIPVVALCDANNETRNVDMVIPTNNKGRRSLAVIYWLLTKEMLKSAGRLKDDKDFVQTIEEFEAAY